MTKDTTHAPETQLPANLSAAHPIAIAAVAPAPGRVERGAAAPCAAAADPRDAVRGGVRARQAVQLVAEALQVV